MDPEAPAAPPPPAPLRGPARRWTPRAIAAAAAELALVAIALGVLGLWCSVPDTAPLATENPDTTAFIELRRAESEAAGKPFRLRWDWRSLHRVSRYLRAAVIYAEDYNFYRHDGVDWSALEDALEANLERGGLAIGGSTITQQLAKNLYLSPRRSFLRKAREMLIAFALEDQLSKQRILELYLNVVEWGDGVFGAEAAARHWFHRSAQALTPAQAVRLAIALPNPIARAPNVRSALLTRKAVRIIRLLRMQGLLDEAEERTALAEVGAATPQREPATDTAVVRPEHGREKGEVDAGAESSTTPPVDPPGEAPDDREPRADPEGP